MDQQEISEFISVGLDYLWMDEVLSLSATKIVAQKHIAPDLPVLGHHYHGFPLFPGALQCEACFQAANVLLTKILPANPGYLPVIARVRNVKFKRLVRPGDQLTIEVSLRDRQSKALFLRGRCSVDGHTTAALDFTATEAPLGAVEDSPAAATS